MNKKTVVIMNFMLIAAAVILLLCAKYEDSDHFLTALRGELRGTGILAEEAQLAGEYSVLVTEKTPAEDVQHSVDAVNRVTASGRFDEKKSDKITLCFIHKHSQRFKRGSIGRFDPEFKLMLEYDEKKGIFTARYLYEAKNLGYYDIHKLFGLPCFASMESIEGVADFDELVRLSELNELVFYNTDVDISKLTPLKKLKKIYVNSAAATHCECLADFPELELAYLHPTFFDEDEFAKAEKVKEETGKDIRYVR